MTNPKALWRQEAPHSWLAIGRQVRDNSGDWWIVTLPEDDDTYGYAEVEISDKAGGDWCRHIWLDEFLRDFRPVV